jgi:HEAT repeat protein
LIFAGTLALILTATTLAAAPPAPASSPANPEGPSLPGGNRLPTYGDARNVELLAAVMAESDPRAREIAVRNLGQTHNVLALPLLRKALEDADATVRGEAVRAAAEFPEAQSGNIVRQGLAQNEPRVALAALDSVRRLKMTSAGGAALALLARPDETLQAAAVQTLTELGIPAGVAEIRTLLKSPSPAVRLQAAENALLAQNGNGLAETLLPLAAGDLPAIRGAALAALAKFDAPAAAKLWDDAAASGDPLLRRGAVRAFQNAGKTERIRPFLDDKSAMVRRQAVQAAGVLRCEDCVPRLVELMATAPDDDSHDAARESLRQIGTPAAADRAAALLKKAAEELRGLPPATALTWANRAVPAPIRHDAKAAVVMRNMASCCRLLGELKSKAGLDAMLGLLRTLDVDSPVLIDLAAAAEKIGDPAATPLLAALLKRCAGEAPRHLAARLQTDSPYYPFSDAVSSGLIQALCGLGAADAVPDMLRVGRARSAGLRLKDAPVAVARDAAKILEDPGYNSSFEYPAAWFEAAKAAGRLKAKEALPSLRRILNQDRPTPGVMEACAWAIEQITGSAPAVPEAKANPGRWIVRPLQR